MVTLSSPSSSAEVCFPETFSWSSSGDCVTLSVAFALSPSPSSVTTIEASGSSLAISADLWSQIVGAMGNGGTYFWTVGEVVGNTFTARAGWRVFQLGCRTSFGGQVTDCQTSVPLSHASVTWGSHVATTDPDGRYLLTSLPCESHALVVSKPGFVTYIDSIYTPTCEHPATRDLCIVPADTPAVLRGAVIEADAHGRANGPIVGATVSLDTGAVDTTDGNGEFDLEGLPPGTVMVTVTKTGYYTVTRTVPLHAGETRYETFQLRPQSESQAPAAFDFASRNGNHFIEGMPGELTFAVNVAWNGSPGRVGFMVAGTQYPATTITDLGGGMARATLELAAPSIVNTCSELTVEIVNADDRRTYVNTGIHFSPIPGIIVPWYRDNIPWTPSSLSLQYQRDFPLVSGDLGLGSGVVSLPYKLGFGGGLEYDLFGAVFRGSVGGLGTLGWDWDVSEVEILGNGRLDLRGILDISLAGCQSPTITPSWEVALSGKAGIGAPAVLIIDVIFPPAAPAVHSLLGIPIVGDVVGLLKLRLFLIAGATVAGEYEGFHTDTCFLGTTRLSGSGTIGIEGQVALEAFGAEAGVYVGGTGTPEFEFCPDWSFQGITLRAYVGVFASAWLFEYSSEVGAEVRFDNTGQMLASQTAALSGSGTRELWQPIGTRSKRWGEHNRLVVSREARQLRSTSLAQAGGSSEVSIVENVTPVANPTVAADPTDTHVLYTLFDPTKPWYLSTDIATSLAPTGQPWSLGLVSDDTFADFAPKIQRLNQGTDLAAWARISGDVSGAADPGDVAPHFEIAAAWFDRSDATWTIPAQLTTNSVVDRDPLPVIFGTRQGIVWIQNEGGASPGDAINGDRLMYTEWSGAVWGTPQTLWSAARGILGFSFAADATAEGHLVFVVDEDGSAITTMDRELYQLSTAGGTWQPAMRLTTDSIEDALPTLVAPNGSVILIWRTAGTLSYTALDTWNPASIYSEYTIANEAPSLAGVTMPGGAAVAYTIQGSDGVDIVVAFFDAFLDRWSLPRRLTHDEHVETALSLADDGSELVIAYLKTQTERNALDIEINGVIQHIENIPQPARTDLFVLRHALGHDLVVDSVGITVDPANPLPGSSAVITAAVENRGDLPVEDVSVAFYDGAPNGGGALIGEVMILGSWIAGTRREASIVWNVPTPDLPHQLFVVVDSQLVFDDRDRSNNEAAKWTVLPDITIESLSYSERSDTSVALSARLVNRGSIPAEPFELAWRLSDPDGAEATSSAVLSIGAGESLEMTDVWIISDPSYGEYLKVYAVADATHSVLEHDENNNVVAQLVQIPLAPPGDITADGNVDLEDFVALSRCMSGPGTAPNPASHATLETCLTAFDFDADADVDLTDFGEFLGLYGH